MATKQHQKGLQNRLHELIDEAGGRPQFMRDVWGPKGVERNKSKVGKWLDGTSGMRADEAEVIAKRFASRPAWLLYGEEPRRPSAVRPLPALADELRNEVLTRAFAGRKIEPAVRAELASALSGEDMLNFLAELLRRDTEQLTRWARRNTVLRHAMERLKGLPRSKEFHDVLQVLGEWIEEEAVTSRRSPWMARVHDPIAADFTLP